MARALLAEQPHTRKSERRLCNRRSRASHLLVSWDNLINPIIQSASLLAASNDPSQFLSDVISAVRYLLACSGAMANDAPLLDSFPALAEQRRVVLSCLSHLVIQTRSHVDLAKSANELIEAVKDYAAVARESGMGNPTQNGGEFKIDDSNIAAALKVGTRERSIIDKLEGHRINVFSLLDNITAHGTITFEKRAEILEMTRKAVEAVRAYLSVLERDFGSDTSNIQEEPNMVSVILSKEAVYTAATNLVTAVRVASSLYGATMEEQKEDNEHVQTSIERVRVAILDSLRAMRFLSENSHDGSLNEPNARERLEMSASLRRAQTLSYLSRKATSLDVLKGQYLEDVERDRGHSPDSSLDEDDLQHVQAQLENHVTSEGRKSLDKAQALIQSDQRRLVAKQTATRQHVAFELSDDDKMDTDDVIQEYETEDVDQIDALAIGNAVTVDEIVYPRRSSLLNKSNSYNPQQELEMTHRGIDRSISNEDVTEHQRHSSSIKDNDIRHFSGHSSRTSGASSRLFRQSFRSSTESCHITPVTTPEPMSPISDVDSLTYRTVSNSRLSDVVGDVVPHLPEDSNTPPNITFNERPYSQQPPRITTAYKDQRSQQSLSLPPQNLRVASSKSAPTDNILRQVRRSRGMSVSSVKMSLKQKQDDDSQKPMPNRDSSHFKPPALRHLRRTGSWRDTDPTIPPAPEVKERQTKEVEVALPWFLEPQAVSFDDDSVITNNEGHIMGGTLKALIERLTMHDKATDITFSNAFLLNFHLFTTPEDFFQLLKERFSIQPPGDMPLSETELELWTSRIQVPIRLRVYNVIKTWLEGFFSVEHDQNMRDALMEFAADDMAKVMPGPAKRMVELINRRFSFSSEGQLQQQQVLRSRRGTIIEQQQAQQRLPPRPSLQKTKSYGSLNFSQKASSITGSSLFNLTMFDDNNDSSLTAPPPPPIISKHLRQQLKKFSTDHDAWQQLNLLDIDPVELSRQMTLIENTLFCDIAPQEMLGQEFKKKVGVSSAIHVKAMIQLSTRVTGWIAESVLAEKEVKRRAAVIKYWIKVGDSCLQLQNYNTLMAIRSALDSTGVSRLRRTWDQLSSKHKNTLETMRSATDTSRNFAKYRQRLKGAIAPCLPFLGVYLTDMTFIDDGNSNVRTTSAGKELINFDKHIKATKVISEIQRFQLPYRLVPVEELQYFLHKNLDATDANDQELYTRSLRLEPREEDAETRSATSSERS
jgi:hypothetical protein